MRLVLAVRELRSIGNQQATRVNGPDASAMGFSPRRIGFLDRRRTSKWITGFLPAGNMIDITFW
jgi:hypothetical protein